MIAAIAAIMEHDTAGDPMSGLKWTKKTTRKISRELGALGIQASRNTVGRLLRKGGFSLRVNHKKLSKGSPLDRDRQFRRIQSVRATFENARCPVISVDTKKKELVGQFKNAGATWEKKPVLVNDHDFRSDANGMAIPYGILDLAANRGSVFVGVSHDTPAFAAEAIARWWKGHGHRRYPDANRMLILADSGGSNGARVRTWKREVQRRVCDPFGITVTVCHYPGGASKWNPIEHKLFSEISKNWAGRPLDSYETIVKYISTTKTETGLRVSAAMLPGEFPTGERVTDKEMKALNFEPCSVLPKWNYEIRPGARVM